MLKRQLFELAGADPQRLFSPYAWRTRLAMVHKQLDFETVPWRFLDKEAIAASEQTKVPCLNDQGKWVSDSWTIANYLEDTYPEHPSLFGGESARQLTFFYNNLGDALNGQIFTFVAADIPLLLDEENRNYFVKTREERFGKTLAEFSAKREERLPQFQASLSNLRATLSKQKFFGGDSPLYADHIMFGGFQWARCVSPFELLEKDDPVYAWRERMLDAYGGVSRQAKSFF
jgi:glutathione S-transferase